MKSEDEHLMMRPSCMEQVVEQWKRHELGWRVVEFKDVLVLSK